MALAFKPSVRRSIAALTLLWSIPGHAVGQEPADRARFLGVSTGMALEARRDGSASPMRYSGSGPFVQIGYERRSTAGRFALRVGAAGSTLTSALTANGMPRQAAVRGWIEGEYLRALGGSDSLTRWLVGATGAVRGSTYNHFYADPNRNEARYGYLSAALGPAAGVERRAGTRGVLSARLAFAAFALVGRPYSDLRLVNVGGLPLRVATIDTYHSVDLAAAFALRLRRAVRLTLGYRLILERLDDTQPLRVATQAVSLTAALRWLGGP